jgi:hydrogenase expression/formation protein HypE
VTEPGFALDCPVPKTGYDRIVMAHGGGGKLGSDLVRKLFLPAYGNDILARLEDQATLPWEGGRLAFTTDAFVVRPIFFRGGDIGKLAINGTVNDLAVGGARPLYLSASFILEEGLPVADLQRIATSMGEACRAAKVRLVTGDTKVVDAGKGDQVFITTSGVGVVPEGVSLSIRSARPGDRIVLSGTIGDHGMAILSQREGIELESTLESDTAPLTELAQLALRACPSLRVMRDPTRGGVAATLHELAQASGVGVRIEEEQIPLRPEVRGACELLGLDPLYVANEGKLVAVVSEGESEKLVEALREHPLGRRAAVIGRILEDGPGIVRALSSVGGERVVTLPAGEPLPRIC